MTKTVKCTIALLSLIFIALVVSLSQRPQGKSYSLSTRPLDTMRVVIGVEGGMYYSKGYPVAAQYELLKRFSELEGIHLVATDNLKGDSLISYLRNGEADMIVVNTTDSVLQAEEDNRQCDFISSQQIFNAVWVVHRNQDRNLLKKINMWSGYFSTTKEFGRLKTKYFGSYSLDVYKETLTQSDKISPYDPLIKEYSRILGWDWRLLAAIIYKESRFSVVAESARGAKGLMQVRESTAKSYGVDNLLDPEQNIYAGVKFLESIQTRYLKSGLDSINSIKFTLAAYNAGESRINDCIRFTQEHGGDSFNWESVSRHIPMMSMPEYYANADYLNHGPFNGQETINYVDNVTSIYEEYLFYVKK